MENTIKPAAIEEKAIIRKLLQPYLTELARFPDENPDYIDENGIYYYPYLDAYWQEETRFPYLLYVNEKTAGFALVRKDGDFWHIAEFYVLAEFRRHGRGFFFAAEIFKNHPGLWKIGFNKHNLASRRLWKTLANKLAKSDVEEGEADASHDYMTFRV